MIKPLLTLLLITSIYTNTLIGKSCDSIGKIRYKNALYTGECKHNKKEGIGHIVYNNGNDYEGSFKNDKKDGQGKYKFKNGSVYNGSWKNNTKDGYGVFTYNNGIVYKGNFVNNIKEGKGSLYYASGDIFEGEFKNNKQDGYGVYTYVIGASYSGDWSQGIRSGKGIFKHVSGAVYEGDFKNNAKNGQGRQTYVSGSVYDGSWVKNVKEGKGTYVDSTGAKYEGYFKNNKKSGEGVLTYVDGKVHIGSWLDGFREGKGTLTYPNGKVFYGSWHKNKREGVGTQVTQYGTCKGVWKSSKLTKITNEVQKKEIYKYFNMMRTQAGMIPLNINDILEKSAKSHSYYIELHEKELKGLSFHHEIEGKKGFSGVKSLDRAISAGYYSRNVGEGISTFCTAKESINSLMTAIYHRFGILSFSKNEVGVGYAQNPSRLDRNFVHNTGNSKLNELCKGDSTWIGNYYKEVCKDKTLKVKKAPYEEAKSSIQKRNPEYVIWPSKDSKNNLYYFKDEVPNPIPDKEQTGNPISIEFNPYYFKKAIVMDSFRLYKNNKEVTNTRILTKQTDPNKKFKSFQYALFPLDVLERNSVYNVEFNYSYNDLSDTIKWSFTTME